MAGLTCHGRFIVLEKAIVFAYTHEIADLVGIDDDSFAELLDFSDIEKLRAAGDPLPSELHNEAFTVYRGEAGSGRKGQGLSWTLDIDYAKHFAKRRAHLLANAPGTETELENPAPVVLRTEVTADQVLFYHEDEREVVVRLDENVQPDPHSGDGTTHRMDPHLPPAFAGEPGGRSHGGLFSNQ